LTKTCIDVAIAWSVIKSYLTLRLLPVKSKVREEWYF